MEDAIKAVEAIKQKKEDDVKKLDDALEILQGVDLGSAAPVEVEPEVPESPVEAEPESPVEAEPESPVEAEPESPVEAEPESPVEAEPESPVEAEPEAPVEAEPEGSPFEDNQEENTDTVIPPKSELKELQEMNSQLQEPKEEGLGETFNNMFESTKEYFSPKTENEEKKGGKRKNRKSRKGLRTKRFRGGNNRKTKKGRRNSRRLRK